MLECVRMAHGSFSRGKTVADGIFGDPLEEIGLPTAGGVGVNRAPEHWAPEGKPCEWWHTPSPHKRKF